MIVFVCGDHQENKNGSTFLLSEIENTCIKIEISVLHLVKLPPIYIFQIFQQQILSPFSRDSSVSAIQTLSKNIYWVTDIFCKISNFNYFPP